MTSKAKNKRLTRSQERLKAEAEADKQDEMMRDADEMREEQMRTDERYEQDSHGMWHFTG